MNCMSFSFKQFIYGLIGFYTLLNVCVLGFTLPNFEHYNYSSMFSFVDFG